MKTLTKTLGVLTLSALLAISNPAVAQTTSDNTGTTTAATDTRHDDDDTGKWGLAGLLGLLGLLGLRKRDDDRHRTTTTVNR